MLIFKASFWIPTSHTLRSLGGTGSSFPNDPQIFRCFLCSASLYVCIPGTRILDIGDTEHSLDVGGASLVDGRDPQTQSDCLV